MSYDLTFLVKSDGQSWEDALEALEERAEDEAGGGAPDGAAWERIVADARGLLGEVALHAEDGFFELDHEATGIQVSLYDGEAAVTVPYWYAGERAEPVVRLIYQLGLSVERHTGLAGYDGQVGMSVADAAGRPELAVSIFDQTARSFAGRGISSPSGDA
ncbi:hypothetical protein [Actinoplanes utahensis]|uniref:Uncharacterized protein n=1 Tax=Actinoplanes utahensis TaxID=1869 RepID=A0A0A6UBV1_ACTUT|nr:hypothetical protein [Actinoplanes utahensis]KHD73530.1 hypothetical protein MB27_33815 [Actinoplanes utahensis]GIF33843.1 hypothetical protein Aut01nite_68290 [Actinoplanes utahensis]